MTLLQEEYLTASEYKEKFESDNEPPQDLLDVKKMIHKGKELRIIKQILEKGQNNLHKPAPCDYILVELFDREKNQSQTL